MIAIQAQHKAWRRSFVWLAPARYLLSLPAVVWAAVLLVSSPATAAANSAQEEVTRNFDKTLPLAAGQTFQIEHKFGEVKIHGESGREVKIHAAIRVQLGSRSEAEEFANKIQIEVSQSSQGVQVRTVYPDKSWFSGFKRVSYSVDYDIAMPSDSAVTVRNSFGNVNVNGVTGSADLENRNGQMSVSGSGPAKLTNAFGAITLSNAGGNSSITNNNGSVTASSVKGSLDVRNRFGNISVSNIQGALTIVGGNGTVDVNDTGETTISNSFGAVNARGIRGNLAVNDTNGAIEATDVKGNATLSGSFGSVNFSNVSGSVTATAQNSRVKGINVSANASVTTTFGEVSLEQVGGSAEVQDSNGNVRVKEVRGYAKLNTSFGAIEASSLHKGARATTGNGRIHLIDVDGDVFAKTSFGAVEVQRTSGGLTVENSNGPVRASNIKGDVSARTSFGSATVEEVGGQVSVDNQNGAVVISAARSSSCKNISAKTSFSSIQVHLPEEYGYTVSAHTSFGRISSDLAVTAVGEMGSSSLNGKIGNGACQLSLTNSNGSIEILKLAK